MNKKLRYLLLMLLLAVFNLSGFADEFTFQQNSKNSGTLTNAPDGVSYSFENTGSNANDQLTGGNSMTLTIYGLTPNYKLEGVRLNLRNNKSSGKGEVVISQGETVLGTYTVEGLGNTYIEKDIEITPTAEDGDIVVAIEASANSVYCDKFTFIYSVNGETPVPQKTDVAKLNSISPTTMLVGDMGEFTLDATFAEGLTDGEDYEVNWSSSNTDVVDVAGSMYEAKAAGNADVTVSVTVLDDEKYNEVSKSFTVTVKGTNYETVQLPYEETLVSSKGKFTIEDVEMGGLTEVWKTSKYGMTANGYKCTGDVESWFVSPLIDATSEKQLELTFDENLRYFADTNTAAEQATLWVREGDKGEWNKLTIPTHENVSDNNFSNVGTIDLNDYAGKTIQLGFKYMATTENPGRWEIKNFSVAAGETVEKEEAGIKYSVSNFTATIGEETDFPVLENPNNLDVTYASTHEDIATVDENGEITLLAVGQTTIKATTEENESYKAGEASYLLVVKEKSIEGKDVFELVTDDSSLAEGDVIILAYIREDGTVKAMGKTQNKNNRSAEDATINDDGTITPGSTVQQITLEDGFYFNVGDGYLYAASSSENYLRTKADKDDNAKAAITIDEDGNATIEFQGSNTRNMIGFNPNNGNNIFSCYDSPSTLPRIYRKIVDSDAVSLTIGATGYATLYYGDKNLVVPEGVEAYTYAVKEGKLEESWMYGPDEIIPAATGVVLKAEAGKYIFNVTTDEGDVDNDNMLKGSDVDEETTGEGCKFYMLSMNADKDPQSVGFYYAKGCANGEAFVNKAHRAYLAVPESMAAKAYMLNGTDAIESVEAESNGMKSVYTLSGIRMTGNNLPKGLYIVGGKKMLVK